MTLADRMVYGGIVNSRRMAQLSWFQRDFFRNLIHVSDQFGRFEADVGLLRSVLYGVLSHKVSARDVQEAMARCHQIGLVKLYQVDGRGYGKVINYRQTLKKRRALYPDEDGAPPEQELFSAPEPEGKKEEKSPQPPAAAGGSDASPSLSKPSRPARKPRGVRLPSLDTLREEVERLENDMTDILRPGGCAFNATWLPPEKAQRLNELKAQHARAKETLNSARAEMSRRNSEDAA